MFEGNAEPAMSLYALAIPGARIKQIDRYGPGEQGAEGAVKRGSLDLAGHDVICFDSFVKHGFSFTPATSFFVNCESADQLDAAFERLAEGGKILMPLGNYGFSQRFGWCNDRFGVSWQLNLP